MFQSLTNKFIPNLKESSRFYRAKIGIFQGKVSITVNSFLFIIKLSIGIITGAISLIADAIHTLSDMITSGIVIWGFKQTDKPADARHPYGHGRAEYIATLIIAVLLCVAGIEFIEVSIERIRNPIISSPEWWMVGMIVFTIIIKEITARYAKFLSSKIASGLLHADAWHHRMDAISSTLVICALIAGKYGFPTIDGWAGLGVAMLLIYTGFDIARDSVDDLIGTPPNSDELDRIREIVLGVSNTLGVHDIVVHNYGHEKYISLHVEIDARKTAAEAHDISEAVETILEQSMGVEPTVHIDPVYPDNPMVKKVKKLLELISMDDDRITNIHDIRIVNTDNHNLILFGVNVSLGMSRQDILDLDHELQKKLIDEFGDYEIKTKISPIHKH
ncbi:MAG: cation diffusion facilitator family transporter [Candidatus Neomarinimicrobiota bacterium]|nr:cation diffusion facilitator family transporter [Candidatus Neomarinimicrobiota bacterium]MEC7872099.1 cation diffusion facilitator family transporter [Candidatus Neomarinimicrobiota bacterium]MEC9436781.1 cation diffusion facilitator family transporter [Candidatus Neomarinimicrobiota bacterium]MEE3303140.1 cation diffusion facilitator family transporter [Candidatus Neomarinimicrobiota bacterium]|tara:strand:+ start:47 stop:1213 length:1167 start_codon:yes stop_codon:yes gene_type:complete